MSPTLASALRRALAATNAVLAAALLATVGASLAPTKAEDVLPLSEPTRRALGTLRPVDLFADHAAVARELDRPPAVGAAPSAPTPDVRSSAADELYEVLLVHLHPSDSQKHAAIVRPRSGGEVVVIQPGERIPGARLLCAAIGRSPATGTGTVTLVPEPERPR